MLFNCDTNAGKRLSDTHSRELMHLTPSSHSVVGSASAFTPKPSSSSLTFLSHPQGSIFSVLQLMEPSASIRFRVSRSINCTPFPLPFICRSRSLADSISATSTKSPSLAHKAGKKPKSAYRVRAAFGAVKCSLPAAKTKSWSGLKICSVIDILCFILQRYDKNGETEHA